MRTESLPVLLALSLIAGCKFTTKVTRGEVPHAQIEVAAAAPVAGDGGAAGNIAGCPGEVSAVIHRVTYGNVLCVRAGADGPLKIDVGQNLISATDFASGRADGQVYYSLAQVIVPAGEARAIPAVCGGAGAPLAPGTQVIAGPRLPAVQATILARLWATLETREREIAELRARLAAASEGRATYEETIQTLEIDTSAVAGLLREAVITSMSGLWRLTF